MYKKSNFVKGLMFSGTPGQKMLVCDVTAICPIHLCHLQQDLHCSPVRACVCECVCVWGQ